MESSAIEQCGAWNDHVYSVNSDFTTSVSLQCWLICKQQHNGCHLVWRIDIICFVKPSLIQKGNNYVKSVKLWITIWNMDVKRRNYMVAMLWIYARCYCVNPGSMKVVLCRNTWYKCMYNRVIYGENGVIGRGDPIVLYMYIWV